jgi:hypothetical protein
MTSFDILIVVCVVLVLLLIGSGSAAVYYYLKETKKTTCAVCPPPAVVDCAVSCRTTAPDCSKVTCTNMVVTQDECTTQFPCPTGPAKTVVGAVGGAPPLTVPPTGCIPCHSGLFACGKGVLPVSAPVKAGQSIPAGTASFIRTVRKPLYDAVAPSYVLGGSNYWWAEGLDAADVAEYCPGVPTSDY